MLKWVFYIFIIFKTSDTDAKTNNELCLLFVIFLIPKPGLFVCASLVNGSQLTNTVWFKKANGSQIIQLDLG